MKDVFHMVIPNACEESRKRFVCCHSMEPVESLASSLASLGMTSTVANVNSLTLFADCEARTNEYDGEYYHFTKAAL